MHEFITAGETKSRTIATDCMNAKIGCVECKNRLVDSIAKLLMPFQEARAKLANKDDYIKEVLYEGGKKARAIIAETVAMVRDKMGIVLFDHSVINSYRYRDY